MKARIAAKSRIIDKPSAAEMMIQAAWSSGIIVAKGGCCPAGISILRSSWTEAQRGLIFANEKQTFSARLLTRLHRKVWKNDHFDDLENVRHR